MLKRLIIGTWLLTGFFQMIHGQRLESFNEDPSIFIEEFSTQLKESGKMDRQLFSSFSQLWETQVFTDTEKKRFIFHVNKMVDKNYGVAGNISLYAESMTMVKGAEVYAILDPTIFQNIFETCLDKLDRSQISSYLNNLTHYLPEGKLRGVQSFHWKILQQDPALVMKVLPTLDSIPRPVLEFDRTTLRFSSEDDSMKIEETIGFYDLLTRTFYGKGGRTDWSKLNLPPDDVHCYLFTYEVDVTKTVFNADSVEFFYKSLLNKPLIGRFQDRNLGVGDSTSAKYPFFESYSGDVVIENWIPNVRYQGGFTLRGLNIEGSAYDKPALKNSGNPEIPESEWESPEGETWGPQRSKSRIDIKRGDRYVLQMVGEYFELGAETISGTRAATTIHTTDGDSIYHPGLDLSYSVEDRVVVLKKPRRGAFSHIPYTSSYHDFYLYFETLIWDIETDSVSFTSLIDKENKMAAIESFDYFKEARFNQAKHILRFNPVGAIYRFALLNKGDMITPENVLKSFPKKDRMVDQLDAFEQALPALESAGYINYDRETHEITPQPKLFKWTMAARGKKDYDAIQLISKVDSGDHAFIDLNSQELVLKGVPFFSFTDSQFVRVIPHLNEVFVEKDRKLRFGGKIGSGKIDLNANKEQNFRFDYESFKIICDSVETLQFQLVRSPKPDSMYTPLEKALNNTIFENISGAIHIDDPSNKSGKASLSHFPVFDSYQDSYIYWDRENIQGGVYHRDSLYFAVYPFVLDSLDNFSETGLLFAGEFYSSDIFPKFQDTLTVMPDFTLGFNVMTPGRGYDIYDYKGKFMGDIVLDGQGLQGKGKLDHSGIDLQSDSIVFHFDSVMAFVDSFRLEDGYRKGNYFPKIKGHQAVYTWYPQTDQIVISTLTDSTDTTGVDSPPILVFEGEAEFFGTLTINADGLLGNGKLRTGEAVVSGSNIMIRDRDFEAVGATFTLIDSLDPSIKLFEAPDVNVKYDVSRHRATFGPNGESAVAASLEQQGLKTTLNIGEYDRSTGELNLTGGGQLAEENYFEKIDENGETMKFQAEGALYKMNNKEIHIEGVPFLTVADAIITPKDLEIFVRSDGRIDKLEEATIVADLESKTHNIYDATVEILGANSYEGSGKYDYIEVDGVKQFIEFDNIQVLDKRNTYAVGKITQEQNFYLTDRIIFEGTVELSAEDRFLRFDGDVKIESDNPVFEGEWFAFEKTTVNPDSVFIPISEYMSNEEGDELVSGLMYIPSLRLFYSNFLQPKEDPVDDNVLLASGGLTVDRKTKSFRIGPEDKIKNKTYRGTTVSYNDQDNVITSKGLINFPHYFMSKTAEVKMAGAWQENLVDNSIQTDVLLGIDLNVIPKDALQQVVTQFHFFTVNKPDIDYLDRSLLENISELLDEGKKDDKMTNQFIEQVNDALVYTDINLGALLPYTILLSGVNFQFDQETGSLYSSGKTGLISLGGKPINKIINARVLYEIGRDDPYKDREFDKITVYLELDEFNWVFFSLNGEVVRTVSQYDDYNVPILEEMEKQKKGNSGFRFELASKDEAINFKRKIDGLKQRKK